MRLRILGFLVFVVICAEEGEIKTVHSALTSLLFATSIDYYRNIRTIDACLRLWR
jgi:hypothetical protein